MEGNVRDGLRSMICITNMMKFQIIAVVLLCRPVTCGCLLDSVGSSLGVPGASFLTHSLCLGDFVVRGGRS